MSNALPFSGAEHEEDTSIEMSCSNAARNSESALVEPGNTGLDTMNDGDDITDESHILESFAGTESTGEAGTEPAPEKLPEEGGEATDTTEEKEFVDPPDSAPITPAYNIADISGSTSALPEDSDEQHSAPVCLPAGEVFGFRRIEYVENVSEEMVAISVEVSGEFGEDPGEEPGEVVSTPEEAVTDSEGWDVDPSEYAPISVETGEGSFLVDPLAYLDIKEASGVEINTLDRVLISHVHQGLAGRGWTQKDLAARVGRSEGHVCNLLRRGGGTTGTWHAMLAAIHGGDDY